MPDWSIDDDIDLPALLAGAIYDADPQYRGKRKWARLPGISRSGVPKVLQRAAIKRGPYTIREEVDAQRKAKDRARENSAKIIAVEVDEGYQVYEAGMDIPNDRVVILQPPARHEVISDEKQIIKAPAGKSNLDSGADTPKKRETRTDSLRMPSD